MSESFERLMVATFKNRPQDIDTLLEDGVDVNAATPGGTTALMIAASCGHHQILEILCGRGADLEMKGDPADGQRVLRWLETGDRLGFWDTDVKISWRQQILKIVCGADSDLKARVWNFWETGNLLGITSLPECQLIGGLGPCVAPKAPQLLLFAFPTMTDLAHKLNLTKGDHYELGTIKWGKFPDGTPEIMIENVKSIQGRDVVLLTSFRNPALWMEQIAVMYSIPRYMAQSLTVVLPYWPTGTMERVEEEGQVATAMSLSRMMNACPGTKHGPVRLVIFDIHTLQNRFYFGDTILPCLLSALPLLTAQLRQDCADESVAIAFPDDGACGRFGAFFKDTFPLVVCSKVREGDTRKLEVTNGNPEGCHCVIVDDLVQSGGTLRTCKDVLLRMGAKKVSAFVTHPVFHSDRWKDFIHDGWACVYVTDSIPETCAMLEGNSPFKVLSISSILDSFLTQNHR